MKLPITLPSWPSFTLPKFFSGKLFTVIGRSTLVLAFLLFVSIVLLLTYKGDLNSYQAGNRKTGIGTPFEATNTSSRFALTEAIVEQGTFELTEAQARFSAPDMVYVDGKFFSIFTPGVSFFAIPFYILGKYWMSPEFTSFGLNIVFALLNAVLLLRLVHKLTNSLPAAFFAALTFSFATNAHAYALTLTQHHGAIFILLLGIFAGLRKPSWINSVWFGLLCGAGLLFDFPNLFVMLPIGLHMLGQHFTISTIGAQTKLSIKLSVLGIAMGIVPLFALYGWYNAQTIGSPTRIAQFVGRSNYFDSVEQKAEREQRHANVDEWQSSLPFSTRLQLQGTQILLVSDERSWLYYSPVLLFGIIGMWYGARNPKQKTATYLLVFALLMNVLVYVSVGDPWGGWSFGPRYLLPGAAVMAVFVGVLVARWQRFFPGLIAVGYFLWLSVWISSMGALTSAHIPPKQETIALGNDLPYTWELNKRMMLRNESSSFAYNVWLDQRMTVAELHTDLATTISSVGFLLLTFQFMGSFFPHSKVKK